MPYVCHPRVVDQEYLTPFERVLPERCLIESPGTKTLAANHCTFDLL